MDVLCGILCTILVLSIFPTIVLGMPKLIDWYSLNMDRDYLENRAEKKVRDLRAKLRVIKLEEEASDLEKKLEEITRENDVTIKR